MEGGPFILQDILLQAACKRHREQFMQDVEEMAKNTEEHANVDYQRSEVIVEDIHEYLFEEKLGFCSLLLK